MVQYYVLGFLGIGLNIFEELSAKILSYKTPLCIFFASMIYN